MLNLIQHLTKSRTYETLKRVQGDRIGTFYEIIISYFDGEVYNQGEFIDRRTEYDSSSQVAFARRPVF